jgi:hypothetical protein
VAALGSHTGRVNGGGNPTREPLSHTLMKCSFNVRVARRQYCLLCNSISKV